jgi:hypothetical protein
LVKSQKVVYKDNAKECYPYIRAPAHANNASDNCGDDI